MPPEPKKPIEELLEASAQMRRAEFGADPKMPNPMRAQLHDEIARTAQRNELETPSRGAGMWWPRIAIGAAMAALVIGAPLMWWQSRQSSDDSFRLAMDRTKPAKELRLDAVPPVTSQSAPLAQPEPYKNETSEESKSIALAKAADENPIVLKSFADVAITAPQAPAAQGFARADKANPEAQTRPLAEKKARFTSGTGKIEQETARSRPLADSGSPGQERQMEGENLRQQFSQTSANQASRRDLKPEEASKILSNFQFEQEGRQIRVVDADGSTYTGKIDRLGQSDARNLEKQNVATTPERDVAESAKNDFYFHATGYNGSLKKSLVFEGNYIVTASPLPKAPNATNQKDGDQVPARIIGTAKIHGEPAVRVDAISVSAK